MILKNPGKIFFSILLISLIASQGCARIASPIISFPITPTSINIPHPAKTLTTDFGLTADYIETASLKDSVTDSPAITATPTSVPLGTYALSFFYTPLIMNYDPLKWENKNGLHAKNLTSCMINEGGPTDFNGLHSTEVMGLGKINYTVLTFPDSAPDVVSWVYLADEAHATEYGLPVFWVSAKSNEWDKCKVLAEEVLATLHFPSQ